jgi:hypothetical protein
MNDIWHLWSSDLAVAPSGDIATASGPSITQQRLLRRLLTSPGEYIWQPDYGAGLAAFIGQPVDPRRIAAIVRGQIFKEAAVARTPEPVIDVALAPGGGTGGVYLHIRYVDAGTGNSQSLSVPLTP